MEGYVVTQASAMRAAAADGLWLSLRCEPDSCANVRQVTERWWQGRGLPRHLAPPLHDWATLVMADYRSDLLATRATLAGAMLTLLLTAMGSMMLAAHTLQRKRRELVLRKLHGAPAWRMAWLMARELGAVLAGSAVLAGIWQWWAGRLYLSQFVDAVPLTPWPWLVATAGLGLLMVASVSRQLMEAWRIQPIEALRD